MECAKAKRLLGLYLSGGLSDRERRRVEAHLASCRRCAEEVRLYRASYEALGAGGEIRPSPDFQRRLRSRLRGLQVGRAAAIRPARPVVWLRRAAAAAACLALILALWFFFRGPTTAPGNGHFGLTAEEEREVIENLPLLENLDILEAAENGDIGIYKGEQFAAAVFLAENGIEESDVGKYLPANGNDYNDGTTPSGE